jgi:hypothetical protein
MSSCMEAAVGMSTSTLDPSATEIATKAKSSWASSRFSKRNITDVQIAAVMNHDANVWVEDEHQVSHCDRKARSSDKSTSKWYTYRYSRWEKASSTFARNTYVPGRLIQGFALKPTQEQSRTRTRRKESCIERAILQCTCTWYCTRYRHQRQVRSTHGPPNNHDHGQSLMNSE